VYDNFGQSVMTDEAFGKEFIARHMASLLGKLVSFCLDICFVNRFYSIAEGKGAGNYGKKSPVQKSFELDQKKA
jgi:hypothetical protein